MGKMIDVERREIEHVISSCKLVANRLRDWANRYKDGGHNYQMVMRLVDDVESIAEELAYALRQGDRSKMRDALNWLAFKATPLAALAALGGAAEGTVGAKLEPPPPVVAAAEDAVQACETALAVVERQVVELSANLEAELHATATATVADAQTATATGIAYDATVVTGTDHVQQINDSVESTDEVRSNLVDGEHRQRTAEEVLSGKVERDDRPPSQVVQLGVATENDTALPITPGETPPDEGDDSGANTLPGRLPGT